MLNNIHESGIIQQTVTDLLGHMGITPASIQVGTEPAATGLDLGGEPAGRQAEVIRVSLWLDEPNILIGHGGQTLSELQRILRILLNKKLAVHKYLALDINGYKAKKASYLRELARQTAEEVAATSREKEFSPMPAYERRILHQELSLLPGITSESRGEGEHRHIVVRPAQ